ncbi:uncharacterized protein LOC112900525 [Panicum hallii]|uniref:uncharacterized protein LOC112900525 n=1 Tax=Panicum hallii TaxID=206008 RepID=UPI000DF4EF87|nr:uncharacterized protein LOC112900525 [Panicum hallii]
MGKVIKSFPLPDINNMYDTTSGIPHEIFEEASIVPSADDMALFECLKNKQRAAYDEIMFAIDTDEGGLFFVDRPSGTGKTFLYEALLAKVRSENKLAMATATSGVAASIMPSGRTAHSRFKIPLTLEDGGCCSFTKQSGTAKLLWTTSLIIWDEATMTKRQAVEPLDKSLRDIMDQLDLSFGGKTVVFGGDFRQVLPVVWKGSRAQMVDASLRRSYLWDSMRHLELVRNMRAQSNPWFADYLLRIDGGTKEFKRKQFPVRHIFAMTVNKAQGQTIPNMSVYLPEPVFSHGQLYVALSRATTRSNIKILALPPNAEEGDEEDEKKDKKNSKKDKKKPSAKEKKKKV